MSSMTDLVFLLLIFFIMISTLVTPFAVKMDVPSNNTSQDTPPQKREAKVHITAEEIFKVDGKPVAAEELEQYLITQLGLEEEGLKRNVLLTAEESVPAGTTVKVIVMARRHGWNLGLTGK